MSIGYILTRVGQKMGLNPSSTIDRRIMLGFVQEAAQELWEQTDFPGSLKEDIAQIFGDSLIALPSNVGIIRAIREHDGCKDAWNIASVQGKFNEVNVPSDYRKWIIKGYSPLKTELGNASKLKVIVTALQNGATLTITGKTETANHVVDNINLGSALEQETVNSFIEVESIKKNIVTSKDIIIRDIDDNEVSILCNNFLEVRYLIVSVSQYPWCKTPVTGEQYADILYKEPLPQFVNDADEFPVQGYDNIIVNKVLQLWAEEQGKAEEAIGWDAKANRSLARKKEDMTRGETEQVNIAYNPHDGLLRRNRY